MIFSLTQKFKQPFPSLKIFQEWLFETKKKAMLAEFLANLFIYLKFSLLDGTTCIDKIKKLLSNKSSKLNVKRKLS